MGIFDKLHFKNEERLTELLNVQETDIVAPADGEMFDVKKVKDPVFSENMMGKGVAFKYSQSKVVLCAPIHGTLTALYPTGHSFGITSNDGKEVLIHCGIDTVKAKGDGFRLLDKKQGDKVKAGEPIVEVNVSKLSKKYDMSTMLVVLKPNEDSVQFIGPQKVKRGQKINI